MDVNEVECKCLTWINLAHDGVQGRVLRNAVMNLRITLKVADLFQYLSDCQLVKNVSSKAWGQWSFHYRDIKNMLNNLHCLEYILNYVCFGSWMRFLYRV